MKKWLYSLLIFISFSVTGNAQHMKEHSVPQNVREAFQKKYPNTFVYEWEYKRKKELYEAEFIQNGIKYEVKISTSGRWISTERDIKKEELPEAVWKAIENSNYADWKIDDIEEMSSPEYSLFYNIEFKREKRKEDLFFLPDGQEIKFRF